MGVRWCATGLRLSRVIASAELRTDERGRLAQSARNAPELAGRALTGTRQLREDLHGALTSQGTQQEKAISLLWPELTAAVRCTRPEGLPCGPRSTSSSRATSRASSPLQHWNSSGRKTCDGSARAPTRPATGCSLTATAAKPDAGVVRLTAGTATAPADIAPAKAACEQTVSRAETRLGVSLPVKRPSGGGSRTLPARHAPSLIVVTGHCDQGRTPWSERCRSST
jgi:hypothetical protein